MYTPTDDETDARLSDLVSKALGAEFEKGVTNKVDSLISEVKDDIHAHIAYSLEDDLKDHIKDEAQRTASRFMERLRAGDENAVTHFLRLPNGVTQSERERHHDLLKTASQYGGIALRKKLLEAVLPRLEAERIKDLEAESDARLTELRKVRLENKELRDRLDGREYEISMLRSQVERLEAKPNLSVVGE